MKELRILKLHIRKIHYQVSYNQFRSTSLRKNARFSLPPGSNNGGTDLEKASGNNHLDDEVDSRTPLTTTSSQNKATANHHHSSLAERIRDKIQVGKNNSIFRIYHIILIILFYLQHAVPHHHHSEKPGNNNKAQQSSERKLRAFVGFLFLAVVFLVSFAYIFYYQQLARVIKKLVKSLVNS